MSKHLTRRDSAQPTFAERVASHFRHAQPGASDECLLLDVSGSMSLSAGTGRTRIEELRVLAAKFPDVRKFVFASICEELTGGIPDAGGGTSMHVAFEELKGHGITHAVIITDGRPDSPNAALQAAHGLRLDIFYVGPDPMPPFLLDLAHATGGQFNRADFTPQARLEEKVRGLLTTGDPHPVP